MQKNPTYEHTTAILLKPVFKFIFEKLKSAIGRNNNCFFHRLSFPPFSGLFSLVRTN